MWRVLPSFICCLPLAAHAHTLHVSEKSPAAELTMHRWNAQCFCLHSLHSGQASAETARWSRQSQLNQPGLSAMHSCRFLFKGCDSSRHPEQQDHKACLWMGIMVSATKQVIRPCSRVRQIRGKQSFAWTRPFDNGCSARGHQTLDQVQSNIAAVCQTA